jgi:hypothetical protein
MALTITGALSAAEAGQGEVRTMMIAALGCNLAWGIIDGGMYLMACFAARGHGLVMLRRLRAAAEPADGRGIVADALPPVVASVMAPEQLEQIRRQLAGMELPARAWLGGRDWLGALGVCLLVFLSTFPVVIPFMIVDDARAALRWSNAVGVAMLFLVGFAFGRHAGISGWSMGAVMVLIGIALVALTIALGG